MTVDMISNRLAQRRTLDPVAYLFLLLNHSLTSATWLDDFGINRFIFSSRGAAKKVLNFRFQSVGWFLPLRSGLLSREWTLLRFANGFLRGFAISEDCLEDCRPCEKQQEHDYPEEFAIGKKHDVVPDRFDFESAAGPRLAPSAHR